jgi:hypothetical protein
MKNKHDVTETPCLALDEFATENSTTEGLSRDAILAPKRASGHYP